MSEPNTSAWPFPELPKTDDLDISAIFGGGGAPADDSNPFDVPPAPSAPAAPETAVVQAAAAHVASDETSSHADPKTAVPTETQSAVRTATSAAEPAPQQSASITENPIAAAFEQKAVENAKQGLLEKAPVFVHKGVKEPIEDASMTFEELRIRKSEDFADLEEGKYVSWSVEYCGIRKEIKDPKGTIIISVKETIERSHDFLDALKKSKDKNPDCFVKPRVVMKTKGIAAAYKGRFANVEEARNSNKVICLIPSCDGRIYEMRKTEQGEFIAPKYNVAEFQQVRAGFTPALPKIPLALIGQLTAFFRSFMEENEEYEAMAQIYWDKEKQEFFAYVPKQNVSKMEIEADLRECPYNDEERYLCYADIHSHNSMEAFFSATDDMDERGTGLYFVVGELDGFFPSIEARISCGGSFVSIDPRTVIEDLEQAFPTEWKKNVTCRKKKIREKLPAANLGGWKKEFES